MSDGHSARLAAALARNDARRLCPAWVADLAERLGTESAHLETTTVEQALESRDHLLRNAASVGRDGGALVELSTTDWSTVEAELLRARGVLPGDCGWLLLRALSGVCGAVHVSLENVIDRASHLVELDQEDLLCIDEDRTAGVVLTHTAQRRWDDAEAGYELVVWQSR